MNVNPKADAPVCAFFSMFVVSKTMQNHSRNEMCKITDLRETSSAICTFRSARDLLPVPGDESLAASVVQLQNCTIKNSAHTTDRPSGDSQALLPDDAVHLRPDLKWWAAEMCWQVSGLYKCPHICLPSTLLWCTGPRQRWACETTQGLFCLWKVSEWFVPGSCSRYVFWPVRSCFRTSVPFFFISFFFFPCLNCEFHIRY